MKALYDNDSYREEFIEAVYELLEDDPTRDRANQIIDLFDSAPEIEDVAQVVHSRWILDSSDEYASHYHCGKCGEEIDLCNEIYTEPTPNYCPNCGAKMDGGGEK